MDINIGDEKMEIRYRGVIAITEPISPDSDRITFNLIAPDGQSISIGQKLDKEYRDLITHHQKRSINSTAYIAWPKWKVMTVWSAADIDVVLAMDELLTRPIEDQEAFVKNLDKTIPVDGNEVDGNEDEEENYNDGTH